MKEAEKGRKPALSVGELEEFLAREFPQVFNPMSGLSITKAWHGGAVIRQAYREDFIRPGGTISGPTMMALADLAMYVVVLARSDRCYSPSPPASTSISCASRATPTSWPKRN